MSRHPNPVPSYRLHKQSGQAVVTLRVPATGRRKDVLLGAYGSPESKAEYARVVAEWQSSPQSLLPAAVAATGVSVNELILAFWGHAEQHYRHADGTPTSELNEYRYSLRPLKELYGHTPAEDFGPLALKAVRGHMVNLGWSRGVVNQRVGRVKRLFKWAAGEELIPVTVYQALLTVAGLARGRSPARETQPVGPVVPTFVDAVLPLVTPPVAAMIRLQRLSGMRPGEVCRMRACDIDMTGKVWLYRPARHKTAWRGKPRIVYLGPQAQAVVREFLPLRTDDHLFSPARGREAWARKVRSMRRTPTRRSKQKPRVAVPLRKPGSAYTSAVYAQAIARACVRAGVPHWHPNQLRHNYATEVRRSYGLEAAQVALGHSRADVTQVYAERDMTLAERIAAEVG